MTEVHTQRAHSKRPPSASHRWMRCFGSPRMEALVEETVSPFANEGTAAHILAERCLTNGFDASRFKGWVIDVNAKRSNLALQQGGSRNGVTMFEVDAGMVDAVQIYLDEARAIIDQSDAFDVESRMDISDLVPGVFGTGDVIAYREHPTRRVTIADLKYGQGVAVEVAQNEQLLTYAVGVVQRFHNRGVDEVELIVVQPRAPHRDGPVRRWTTDIVGLYEHVMALQNAVEQSNKEDALLVAGAHCKFCRAAAICPALRDEVDRILGVVRRNGEIVSMNDPMTVPYRDWKVEEAELNMVKGYAKRREEFAHSEAVRGRPPLGAKLVAKRAIRKWADQEATVSTLRLLGVSDDDLFETSLKSPAQVEKAIPKGERGVIDTLAVKASSGTVLAPLDDPRPGVDPNDASGFDAVEE